MLTQFLGASGRSFGRSISGQMEIVRLNSGGTGSEWQSIEGIYIHPTELNQQILYTKL
jgi:hypothetical protein